MAAVPLGGDHLEEAAQLVLGEEIDAGRRPARACGAQLGRAWFRGGCHTAHFSPFERFGKILIGQTLDCSGVRLSSKILRCFERLER